MFNFFGKKYYVKLAGFSPLPAKMCKFVQTKFCVSKFCNGATYCNSLCFHCILGPQKCMLSTWNFCFICHNVGDIQFFLFSVAILDAILNISGNCVVGQHIVINFVFNACLDHRNVFLFYLSYSWRYSFFCFRQPSWTPSWISLLIIFPRLPYYLKMIGIPDSTSGENLVLL